MGRNLERDEREAVLRKERLIQAGLELFSKDGIESVSLNAVAAKADVGIATMYNYFQNKLNLVVAISTRMWSGVWEKTLLAVSEAELQKMNAYELTELYCDNIIALYLERPEILRFSANYKTFVNREGASKEQYQDQIEALKPVEQIFHLKYEEAKQNKSIRTDIPEKELFSMITLTMLAMAERYAQGLVWAKSHEHDYRQELNYLKDMILNWLKPLEN